MRKKVILLIPLTFNDGSAVPQETLDAICDELLIRHGGYTLAGRVKGAYRMKSGAKQVEELHEVWVAVEDERLDELRERVSRFCALLGQEVMYFEVTEAAVEFIAPPSEEGQTNDQGT